MYHGQPFLPQLVLDLFVLMAFAPLEAGQEEESIKWLRFVKNLASPSTYFIHCDLIDKENNLYNGKPTSILAIFDIKGEAFEKVF